MPYDVRVALRYQSVISGWPCHVRVGKCMSWQVITPNYEIMIYMKITDLYETFSGL